MDVMRFEVDGFVVELAPSSGPLLLWPCFEEEAWPRLERGLSIARILLDASQWNSLLSPWPAPAVFKGALPFAGEASLFLDSLVHVILPEATSRCGAGGQPRIIAGTSMAGLFALWAVHECDAFDALAAVSPSLWYPGFDGYITAHSVCTNLKKAAILLGDNESKGRNKAFSSVESVCGLMASRLAAQGVDSLYRLVPGGHVDREGRRLTEALDFILRDD